MTRWHDDDLAGRILASDDGPNWTVITLPALATHNDTIGRAVGDALWPDRYDETALAEIRSILGVQSFNALYQQNPIPDEGDYFKAADCQWYDKPPKIMHIYGASDFAVTDGSGDFTEHGVFGIDEHDDIYVLDWWTGQTTADVWIENELDLIHKHKPIFWVGEGGPIRRAIEPFLVKRSRERKVYCRFEWLNSIHDKPTRARAFQARWSMRKIYLPKNTDWADRLLSQLTRFPAGANDDAVDVCSLIGRAMDEIHGATIPQPEDKPIVDSWDKAFNHEEENDWKSA
jgi:predicted phage terminase large subunit-like protein